MSTESRGPVGADQQLKRAATLCQLGRFTEARETLRSTVSSEPGNADAWCLLAQATLGLSDGKGALHAAQTAASLAPEREWPHRLMSEAFVLLLRFQEAAEAAKAAIRAAPQSPFAHAQLAHALARPASNPIMRRIVLKEAHAAAVRAVELGPNIPGAHMALGQIEAAAGHKVEAREAFQRVLAINPAHIGAQHELARLHLRKYGATGSDGLAAAASGFSSVVRANPHAEGSRNGLDAVMRVFLIRVAYLIWLDAFIFLQVFGRHSTSIAARSLPVALLVIPAVFARQFILRLPQELRDYLWRLITLPGMLRRATTLECVAVAALIGAAPSPHLPGRGLAILAAAAGLFARLLLWAEQEMANKPADRRFLLDDGMMWFLAVVLTLAAVAFILVTLGSRTGLAGGVMSALCATASAAVVRSVRRRGRAGIASD